MEGPRTGTGAPRVHPDSLRDDARDPVLAAGADWRPCLRDPGLKDVVPVTRDQGSPPCYRRGNRGSGNTRPAQTRELQPTPLMSARAREPWPGAGPCSTIHSLQPPPKAPRAREGLRFAASLGTEGAPFPARGDTRFQSPPATQTRRWAPPLQAPNPTRCFRRPPFRPRYPFSTPGEARLPGAREQPARPAGKAPHPPAAAAPRPLHMLQSRPRRG